MLLHKLVVPGALHGGDVNEHIAAAIIGLDEAIAAFSVEELDRTSHGHRETPPVVLAATPLAYRPDRTIAVGKLGHFVAD